ncbi:MAG: type II toxin-antitoxin system RelE/ParE family toxin [Flavobacteriales bacterium]|nr:type II toxin-antitoxin system RelE/ParE family toxin [Flavobacteriales bacterium]
MTFALLVDPRALRDIQNAIDYYDNQQPHLGKRFENALNRTLLVLETNPYFRIRYDDVRCIPVKKFPFLVHYTVNERGQSITVHAVFHTSLDPQKWIR